MITKYNKYIKENLADLFRDFVIDVVISINISVNNRYNHIIIRNNRDFDAKDVVNEYFYKYLLNIVKKYDKDAILTGRYVNFQLKTQIEYNLMIFYFTYYLENVLKKSTLTQDYKYITIPKITIQNFINMYDNFLNYLSSGEISKLVDNYIIKHNQLDELLINCLTDEQKIKFDYLFNAKNFDLI